MDHCENTVYEYLLSLNIGQVVYEPDGNIPPDFVIGSNIAVEARRLNQNYKHIDGSIKGLETDSIPLWQKVEKILQSYGPALNNQCWHVGINFSRPIGNWKKLESKIRNRLDAIIQSPSNGIQPHYVSDNFELDIMPASTNLGFRFNLAANNDNDAGGFILKLLTENLQLCVAQKELKIAPHKDKYPNWWLVMTDHIGFSLNDADRTIFNNLIAPSIKHSFKRIILLDPRDHKNAFNVNCSN